MFEKEAEEYTENPKSAWKQGMTCVGSVRQAFKDGAEFGYNKAKEEMQEQGLALQSDMDKTIEQNIALKKELNKANEWHKVADEGLPINKNDGATYLLYTIYGEGGSPVVAHFAYRDKQELMNIWTGAILTEDKIVAWKEIVLPEGE